MKLLILLLCFGFGFAENNATNENGTNQIEQERNDVKALITEIESYVRDSFLNFYKAHNIIINNIVVAPAMNINLSKMKIDKIIFDDRLLRRDSGNFEVYLYHNQKNQKVFFTFNINATIDALSANSNIKTNEVITNSNSQITQVPISKMMQLPAFPSIINEYSAKSFIPSGSVIIPSKIEPKIIVQKGDIVEVLYNEQNIDISFSAKALDSGSINKTIRAQNIQSGKIVNVEILSPKTARMD